MPVIQIDIREGRTPKQIRKLQELLTRAAMEAIGAPREYIYVIVRETPGSNHCLADQPLPSYEPKSR